MNSKHAFLALSVFTLVSIAHGEREVFAPTKLAPTATAGTVQFGDGTVAAPSITFKSDTDTGVFKATDNTLGITTGGTERMRITAAGDVGIGATPTNRLNLTYNGVSGVATVGPNSTSGNTALTLGTSSSGTYAERMRIDSAGNVGIGTTPSVLLDVLNPSTAATPEVARFRGDTAATPYVSFFNGANRTGLIQYSATNLFLQADANKGIQIITNGTGVLTQSTGGSERMRITSGGEIVAGNGDTSATPAASTIRGTDGSGTNIAAANLTIQGGRGTGTGAGGAVVFQTSAAGTTGSTLNAATERVRIKAGGQLRFVPLAAAPTVSVEDGDVYYNSTTNKLQVRAAGVWVDLH